MALRLSAGLAPRGPDRVVSTAMDTTSTSTDTGPRDMTPAPLAAGGYVLPVTPAAALRRVGVSGAALGLSVLSATAATAATGAAAGAASTATLVLAMLVGAATLVAAVSLVGAGLDLLAAGRRVVVDDRGCTARLGLLPWGRRAVAWTDLVEVAHDGRTVRLATQAGRTVHIKADLVGVDAARLADDLASRRASDPR